MMYNSGGPGCAGGSARLQETTAAGRPEVKRGFDFLRHDVRGHATKQKGLAAITCRDISLARGTKHKG